MDGERTRRAAAEASALLANRQPGSLTSEDMQAILDKLRNAMPLSLEEASTTPDTALSVDGAVEALRRQRADGDDK
jgi:hypothetical protein